jgi:hypothetical protein
MVVLAGLVPHREMVGLAAMPVMAVPVVPAVLAM